MANRFDRTFRRLATRLIDETFGTSATLRRKESAYNAATGRNVATTTDYPVSASPLTTSGGNRPGATIDRIADLAEGQIARSTVAAAGLPISPRTGDELIIYGRTLDVVAVYTAWSGDLPAAHTLELRG